MEKEANNKAAEEERCNRQSRVEDGINAPLQQRINESDFLIIYVLRVVLVVAVIVVILVVFSLQGNNPQ